MNPFNPRPRKGPKQALHLWLSLALMLTTVHFFGVKRTTYAQQASKQNALRLARIAFEGLQRISQEQVVQTSGLTIGQAVDEAILDKAASRLVDSGLFKKVSYHARTNGNQITLTFEVEETKGGDSPVVFDNFVWFSEPELMNAVRREVPTFSGTAPDLGNLTDAIGHALQRLLSEHNIAGTIEYLPSSDSVRSSKMEHVFSVRGISMPICALHFPGASNVPESKLVGDSKELMRTDYSQKFAKLFAVNNLVPIYREEGQLRASFGTPAGKPVNEASCKNGVDVTIPVEEGLIYSWHKADWTGNKVLTAEELDASLVMKAGEVANGLKFNNGFKAVEKAYGRKGYIAAWLSPKPEFDDAQRRVTFQVKVNEGPQYRMGNLIIRGFSEGEEKLLRQGWQLKVGDVYDTGYTEEYLKNALRDVMRVVLNERKAQGKPLPNLVSGEQPNTNTLTVDFVLELKDSPGL